MAKYLNCDVETFSSVDLAKSGLHKYMESPDFEILLVGYSLDGGPVRVHDCTAPGCWPRDLLDALVDPTVEKRAWNAAFERQALAHALEEEMPPEQWSDTMIIALECGLPGSLAGAGIALGLPEDKLKDPVGKALIRYFSMPCKPTKANGGRTRNLPEHDQEKWKLYIEYNRQDVVTETAIREKLKKYPLAKSEQELWELDQRMNDHGVRIDVPMVQKIVAYDEQRREDLQEEARMISGLSNPNSLSQLKPWLAGRGFPVEQLRKDDLDRLLGEDMPEDVRRVLEIRKALGKTSTAKFKTMLDAVCSDDRIKGILQFYGANRSGRWAGRLVQVHNLSKNYLPDLDLARELVAEGEFETLETLFGEPAFVFSELVRTAFIPSEGNRFVVSDFSAIEARVVAWLAGEQWTLDAFRAGKDIYCETASMMYHVPVVKHGVNGHLRQKGKVAVLACIAEGQQVLTDQGLVPIEKVTTDMRVWDGVEWVEHEGVICRGIREVISYDGLEATEDHIVWAEIDGKRGPVHFGIAAACGARLVQSGAGGQAVRLGEDYFAGEAVHEGLDSGDGPDEVHRLREGMLDVPGKSYARENKRLPELQPAQEDTEMVRQEVHRRETEMREPERRPVRGLRRQGDPVRVSERAGRGALHDREFRAPGQVHGDRQDQQQRELCSGEPPVCDQAEELREPAEYGAQRVRPEILAVRLLDDDPEARAGTDAGRDHPGGGDRGIREAEKLERHPRTVKVYDIQNAGRRHRFTVSGVLVHNCGYQGGVGAMRAMDRGGSIPDEELQGVVDQWRAANPHIVKLWRDYEMAAMTAIREHRPVRRGIRTPWGLRKGCYVEFSYSDGNLFVRLPSGRRLCYWHARLREDPAKGGRESIVYSGVNQVTKQWGNTETYGGKLVENCVQATARDCLAEAMKRVTAMGYQIVMHVHDEMIVDVPKDDKNALQRINAAMGAPIPWAPGLPLKGDGYECSFYKKD